MDCFDQKVFCKRLDYLIQQEINRSQYTQNEKYSDKKLAEELGISRTTFSRIRNGETQPSCAAIANIADYFKVSVDYLMGLSDVASLDKDVRLVCNATGLDEEAVEQLLVLLGDDYNMVQALNSILRERSISELLRSIVEYTNTILKINDLQLRNDVQMKFVALNQNRINKLGVGYLDYFKVVDCPGSQLTSEALSERMQECTQRSYELAANAIRVAQDVAERQKELSQKNFEAMERSLIDDYFDDLKYLESGLV